MKKLLYTTVGLSLLVAPSLAQRQGNPNAPVIGQSIDFAGQGSLELSYASINWAGDRWAGMLSNEATRDQMRAMINGSDEPLGSLKASVDLSIASQRVSAGDYRMAMKLDENYQWEIVLSGEGDSVNLPLITGQSPMESKRLVIAILAGEEDLSGLMLVAFGSQICQLSIGVAAAEEVVPIEAEAVDATLTNVIINDKCPLMEDPVVPNEEVVYRGYRIGFCCEICTEEWELLGADEKDQLLDKLLGGGEAEEPETVVLNNAICPLMEEPVVEGYFVVYKSVQISMCCDDCTLEWSRYTTAEKDEVLKAIWQ